MSSVETTTNVTADRLSFKDLGIAEAALRAITELGFEYPTPIQELVLARFVQDESDIIAMAQTGTGKTAAFGLSICGMINPKERVLQALVITPTRELCVQVSADLNNYTKYMSVGSLAVYGGEPIMRQMRSLAAKPHVLVATPGRLVDLIDRGAVDLSTIRYVVLDEADEMLNMGFKEDLNTILEKTPKERRTLLFSATMPREVASIAKHYMKNAVEVTAGAKNTGTETVEHEYYIAHAKDKYQVLRRVIDANPDMYGIVFCRTRQETQDVASKLMREGYNAEALHGDLTQSARDYAMEKFRIRHLQLLIATDVAARGIDVSNLTHVINYSLPESHEIYNHRSGRTGRAGSKGVCSTIINMHERTKIRFIERGIKREFTQKQIPTGGEIWRAQLAHRIDSISAYSFDEEQASEAMKMIEAKLVGIDSHDLIKRFVMMECERLLKEYSNAPDLNVSFKHEPKFRNDGYNNRNDRGGNRYEQRGNRYEQRGGGYEQRGGSRKFEKSEYGDNSYAQKRDGKKFGADSQGERSFGEKKKFGDKRGAASGSTTRLVLNSGKRARMNAGRLLGMLNDAVGHSKINVDNISVEDGSTYFTVSKKFVGEIVDGFSRHFSGEQYRITELK
ncbi:MAG: DEAD/DEAH box helicase [Candidatus Kapabacteria bacterium]|nr:DEAD/DEAH box helicase [Candidatus Kapabacteria bacterium]